MVIEDSNLWQLNPALAVTDRSKEKKLDIGLMQPQAFTVESHYSCTKSAIKQLRKKNSFTGNELVSLLDQYFPGSGSEIFRDFINLRLITPYIDMSNRYSRHEMYYQFAGTQSDPQKILGNKTVMLLGFGGIGSTCAMLLAAAGIGQLVLVDSDHLELSNLSRTTLFEADDIGSLKVVAGSKRLRQRNASLTVREISQSLSLNNLNPFVPLVDGSDVIVLSGDSGPDIHEAAYRLAKAHNKYLINAGYIENWGIVGPITKGFNASRENELNGATEVQLNEGYRACSYGPLNSLVASTAVNEVLRCLLDLPTATAKRRLLTDSFTYEQRWEEWP